MREPEDPTSEMPIVERPDHFVGHASVPPPVTAIPYTQTEPAYAPPPRSGGRGLLVAGVLVVVLIVCAAGVLVGLSFRDGGLLGDSPIAVSSPPAPPPPPAPKVVAEEFLDAALSGDQATVQQHLCQLLRNKDSGGSPSQAGLPRFLGFKVSEEKIDGSSASVRVDLQVPIIGDLPFQLNFVKEEKVWRVCGFGLT